MLPASPDASSPALSATLESKAPLPADTLSAIGESDVVHRVLKWVSHNRFVALALVISIYVLFASFGCQSTAISPFTSKPATQAEIAQQASEYAAKKQAETVAEQARVGGDVDAKSKATAGSITTFKRKFDLALSQAQAELDQAIAESNADLESFVASRQRSLAAYLDTQKAEAQAQADKTKVALEAIASKDELKSTIFGFVQQGVQLASGALGPAGSGAAVLVLGALAAGLGLDNRRKNGVITELKSNA